ncbi:MAG: tRNA threonylcarbamoyladenosine dehydratase [Bacteriovoracaceae bacterium]|nr:tRNA threonylcarbamoyladenosine dehydratase [Bacteriovoracaceae bacterium]
MKIPLSLQAVAKIYGDEKFQKLQNATVMIVGLGGVGSWAVEALARTGVKTLILVDADDVCVSNINRQIMATYETVGMQKATLLSERVKKIYPDIKVLIIEDFCTESNIVSLMKLSPSVIIDAIDGVANKCLLLDTAQRENIPIICTGGGAGKTDVTLIKIADLAHTIHDPLLQRVRKKLRTKFEFTRKKQKPFGITTVFSTELPKEEVSNKDHSLEVEEGSFCEQKMGSLVTITSTLGMFAAHAALEKIFANEIKL